MEARNVGESTHRVKQICGQVIRFAVASGIVERDVTVDLKGALQMTLRKMMKVKPSAFLPRIPRGTRQRFW
jgi:hypothetical protein